ncbi:hypothetical protein EDB19DRAFT_1707740 [Suillus lakei]|nr:hypothetical protein EDB19DRAFT_1707740 [Suillus lakei]
MPNTRTLIVHGFHPATGEHELSCQFGRFGTLVRCVVQYPAGFPFAFIEFESQCDAKVACDNMHGKFLQGSPLTVVWAPEDVWSSPSERHSRDDHNCHDNHDADRERDRRRRSRSPDGRTIFLTTQVMVASILEPPALHHSQRDSRDDHNRPSHDNHDRDHEHSYDATRQRRRRSRSPDWRRRLL